MALVVERTCETCVYVYRSDGELTDVLLVNRRRGQNAGKWVPLGKPFDGTISAHQRAARDLAEIGLAQVPLLRGIVTEICSEGGWQYILFLFVARAPQEWTLQGGDTECESAWHNIGDVQLLELPQADRNFDLVALTSASPRLFEATMFFSGDGILREIIRHDVPTK